jgi:hypothetical protein
MKNSTYPNILIIPHFIHNELIEEGTHKVCEDLFGVKIIISCDIKEIIPMITVN